MLENQKQCQLTAFDILSSILDSDWAEKICESTQKPRDRGLVRSPCDSDNDAHVQAYTQDGRGMQNKMFIGKKNGKIHDTV